MHPAIIIGTIRSLWTLLWGRYHIPQNAFLVIKQTNFNWGTFSMFNIIQTLQNYFTRELLPDCISVVQWHITLCKLVAAMFGGKLFRGNVIGGNAAPVSKTVDYFP